jgi:hypothetical protein
MAQWSEGVKAGGGDYISTAIGTDIVLTIKEINRITDKPDFEPKNAKSERQGFLFEFIGEEGTVTVSTYVLQGKLINADVEVGDSVRIAHPAKGEYIVEKIN